MDRKINQFYKETVKYMQPYLKEEMKTMMDKGEQNKNKELFDLIRQQLVKYNKVK